MSNAFQDLKADLETKERLELKIKEALSMEMEKRRSVMSVPRLQTLTAKNVVATYVSDAN